MIDIAKLRCPVCGEKVFWTTLSDEKVICTDMGHWMGYPNECVSVDNIDITKLRVGDKVHYQPAHYRDNEWENGKVK